MHILYVHQHFTVPSGKTGTRSYEFARRWVKAGHKVTLITGHYDRSGLEVQRGFVRKQVIEGINVIVVSINYSDKHSTLRRIISFLCFMLIGTYVGLEIKDVDVIYATSTPLTVGIPALLLKWFRRIPFIFEVRDQWPQIPIEMGIIKNKVLVRTLLLFERTIYKNSAAIVVLSLGIADGVRAVVKKDKMITVIPNSCDTELFRPDIDGIAVRRKYRWDDKLILLHFGAMGRVNGLGFLVNVAKRLKSNDRIHLVLLGDGSEKPVLVQKIQQFGLKNIEILDSLPKTELVKIVAACDVSMVIVANYPILQHNSANKFFDSLSAGKPVLLNYSGWQREVLEENKAGFGCDLCNIAQFVEKVLYFNSHRSQLADMGKNARLLAQEKFNRDRLANQALLVVSEVAVPQF